MDQTRTILVPGEPAAAPASPVAPAAPAAAAAPQEQRRKPGPKPRVSLSAAEPAPGADPEVSESAEAGDPAVPDFSPEQLAVVQRMISDAVRASRAGQDPGTAARLASEKLDAQKLPTQAAAAAMCEDSLARGIRPRAILTVDGWYTHPEMARTKAPGVSALGGQV